MKINNFKSRLDESKSSRAEEINNIGYKITKRQNLVRPNDLFEKDSDGKINFDANKNLKILNFLRQIEWDE